MVGVTGANTRACKKPQDNKQITAINKYSSLNNFFLLRAALPPLASQACKGKPRNACVLICSLLFLARPYS